MANTVVIRQGTGAPTGTWATVTAVKWNRVDDASGTTPVPTPTATGTNFSFVKSFQPDITVDGGLTMTDIRVGKVAAEATGGTKLWHRTDQTTYVQASAAPTATGDNNTTAPIVPHTLNNTNVTALGLIGGPPSVYAAGPFTGTGRKGNIVMICLGVDATNTTAGTTVATPTLRWTWTEA